MLTALIAIIAIAIALGFWFSANRVREAAYRLTRQLCNQKNFELLDQSIALKKMRLKPTARGFRFYREYRFEYTHVGDQRLPGTLCLLGMQFVDCQFSTIGPSQNRTRPEIQRTRKTANEDNVVDFKDFRR